MTLLRKLIACLAACGILLLGGGCSVISSLIPTNKQADAADPDTYKAEFKNNWLYGELDSKLQDCYGSLYTALTDGFEEDAEVTISDKKSIGIAVILPHDLTDESEYQKLYTAFSYDNPQFFYVHNTYGLEGYEIDGIPYYNKMVFTYTMDADTRKKAKDRLDRAVQEILSGRPNTTDEYVTELYLHDKLVSACTYDDAAAEAGYESSPDAYNAYSALVKGSAVCEGYSRAMQLLLTKAGIRSTLVVGESISSGEQHMWNLVSVNGSTYHLDATWNDSSDLPRHNYFNVTTAQIELSHRISEGQGSIVSCTATDDNYYHRNGLYFDTYSRQSIAQTIATRIKDGDTLIEMAFAHDKYDNALLFLKSRNAAEEHVEPYLAGSGYTLWEYLIYSEAEEHILCIRKK